MGDEGSSSNAFVAQGAVRRPGVWGGGHAFSTGTSRRVIWGTVTSRSTTAVRSAAGRLPTGDPVGGWGGVGARIRGGCGWKGAPSQRGGGDPAGA